MGSGEEEGRRSVGRRDLGALVDAHPDPSHDANKQTSKPPKMDQRSCLADWTRPPF